MSIPPIGSYWRHYRIPFLKFRCFGSAAEFLFLEFGPINFPVDMRKPGFEKRWKQVTKLVIE